MDSNFQVPVYRAGNIHVTQTSGAATATEDLEDVFLQILADEGVAEAKRILQSGVLKHPTGALAASIRGRAEGKAVVWWSEASYAGAVERGVHPHHMWYLLNKTVPMTLWKYGSEHKIFRKATLRSLIAGKFFNPGRPGIFFFQRAIITTLNRIPELLAKAKELTVQLVS
jgi:hypothetical protein